MPLPDVRRLLLTGVVALAGVWVRAQPPPASVQADRVGTAEGLSALAIADLHQSADGFVWAATAGGVDRFDGQTVRTFRHDPGRVSSLSHPEIHALAGAPGGRLWVGTYGGGLNLFDPTTDTARRIRSRPQDPTAPSDDRVTVLHRDRRGRLWMGTMSGLDRVDERTGRVRRFGAPVGAVRDVADAPDGRLWVGGEGGLVLFDPGRARVVARHVGAPSVMSLASVADGGVWVGYGSDGLARLDPDGRRVARFRAGDAAGSCGDQVHDLALERSGALWVATRDGGVCRLDTARRRFTAYPADADNPRTPASDQARTLLLDRGGLVWVGTWVAGIARLRQTPFRHVRATPAEGFRSSSMFGFAETPDGRLWVGTADTGLYRFDLATGRAEQPATWPADLRSGVVRAMTYGPDGTFWVAGPGATWRLRPGRSTFERVPVDPPPGVTRPARVLHLAVGPDSMVWMAAYDAGLCRAAPGAARVTCLSWPGRADLTDRTLYTLYPDADGTVWVAAWGRGIERVDPARGVVARYDSHPDRPLGLAAASVTSFFRDRDGQLWLTTYGGGISRYDPDLDGRRGGFAHVGTDDGLPDLVTYGLLQADDGTLWVSTNRGLAQMSARGRVEQTFGPEDGLQGDEFNGSAYLRLADGRMVFGGGQGFNVFHPRSLHERAPEPPLAVTALRILGAPAEVPRDLATRGLRLRHDENAVRFEFAALDFTAPHRNRFAYRLDGLDPEWTKAGTDRSAAYTNLAPGDYTLRVRAANSDGVWTDPGLAIPIVVRPAWWQTWAFRLVAGLVLLSGLVVTVRGIAQRRLRAEVRRLELVRRVADERARISRDLHDHVGAQLSSVLAGVEIARLARSRPDITPLRDPLDAVEQDARETMRQLRETIWALHDESVTVGDFAARVEADLRGRVQGRDRPAVRVECRSDPTRVLGPAAALHLFRIVREAATNSLKHADATHLTVEIEDDAEGRLCVCVRDDGAFAGASGDGALGASGFGLRSMRDRASSLGAEFDLDTADGTAVRLRVPGERLRAGVER